MPADAIATMIPSSRCPSLSRGHEETVDPTGIWAIGNAEILHRPLVGLFCSVRCPGDVVLQTYDLARGLRDAGVPIIGGFHTPMEKECLDLLLRGRQPIVICPARGIERMRIPTAWRSGLDDGRLLIVSPFDGGQRRQTKALAEHRNRFVATLAAATFVAYAEPGSKTEQLCKELLGADRQVWLLRAAVSSRLLELGAVAGFVDDLVERADAVATRQRRHVGNITPERTKQE